MDHGHFQMTFPQISIILGLYTLFMTFDYVMNYWDVTYKVIYHDFLKYYNEFTSLNYRDCRIDVSRTISESFKRFSVDSASSDETLAEVLPKTIVPNFKDIFHDTPMKKYDLENVKPKTLRYFQSMPILNQKEKNYYKLVDKLYSVSPKNTFHLVTASATAMTMDELQDNDSSSIHTCDTDWGGGGGGGFKYKMPDGSKISFGGGGGFGYHHYDRRHSEHSHKSHHSNHSQTSQSHSKSNETNVLGWLIPFKSKKSLSKKLSEFNFETSNLLSDTKTSYSSINDDIEITKDEFSNYLNLSLGIKKTIIFDPIFERFNKLIQNLNSMEIFLLLMNRMTWNFGCLVSLSLNFHKSFHLVWFLIILKLFNINYLNDLKLNLLNKLFIKLIINLLVISICIIYALM